MNVRSSFANGGYGSLSGTSMASPHTAGTVALIWAAAPTLQGDINRTMAVLNETAVDTENLTCGGTAADNNVWGEGRLDALAAVNLARLPVGTVSGNVTDAVSGRGDSRDQCRHHRPVRAHQRHRQRWRVLLRPSPRRLHRHRFGIRLSNRTGRQ